MNILVIGGGGREHSILWAIAQNPKCDALHAIPGNAGMAALATCHGGIDPCDPAAIRQFCADHGIDFVIVGPEAPLVAGVADALRAADILTLGPSAAAAQLEASKGFTKEICDACGAPTAGYARFDDGQAAKTYIRREGAPIVVKADGLAAGKGVVVAMTEAEALAAVTDMFDGAFGAAGAEVVIEEFMTGEEASLFVLCDGAGDVLSIGTAQDHKRVGEGDTGPNTGGMGAYAPAPILSAEIEAQVMEQIVRPTVAQMAKRGTPFEGVLYVGLMIENGQARLVEYNVRLGDPECQALMMRLGAQALDLMLACAQGRLADMQVGWADDHAVTVVMAAQGYPGSYEKGTRIGGLEALPADSQQMMFHAGTRAGNGETLAAGGRVLNATARGATLQEARDRAYAMLDGVDWPEGFYRKDIGWRAL